MSNAVGKKIGTTGAPRSKFDISHERRLTADMFYLYPILVEDCIPGDKWRIGNELVIRMMPLVTPILHEINATIHYFFVPKRLMWSDFEKYYFRGKDGKFSGIVPKYKKSERPDIENTPGSLYDHLYGHLWSDDENNATARIPDAWPHRAYNLIWHHFYRDENLIKGLDETLIMERTFDEPIDDQLDQHNYSYGNWSDANNKEVYIRSWEKDYFTSALPWQQKGDPMAVPVSGNLIGGISGLFDSVLTGAQNIQIGDGTSGISLGIAGAPSTTNMLKQWFDNTNVYASFTETPMSFDVTDLRWVIQAQRWKELLARGGSRFIEGLKSFFHIAPTDARLQRPEYIGGSKSPIIVSEVLQTSGTQTANGPNQNTRSPQGTMAGHGITADRTYVATYTVKEPGVIMGILSIMPRTMYAQGLERMWSRDSVYEEYWPQFSQLSEQGIKRSEIYNYYNQLTENKDELPVFGYIGRYDEYRYRRNSVHGKFRTDMKMWTGHRSFKDTPHLNSDFITAHAEEQQDFKRFFAVTSEPGFMVAIGNRIHVTRPMPWIHIPGRMDHN